MWHAHRCCVRSTRKTFLLEPAQSSQRLALRRLQHPMAKLLRSQQKTAARAAF
jgi:hypothetical protein